METIDDYDDDIKLWQLRKQIEQLNQISGSVTGMVSLIIPPS